MYIYLNSNLNYTIQHYITLHSILFYSIFYSLLFCSILFNYVTLYDILLYIFLSYSVLLNFITYHIISYYILFFIYHFSMYMLHKKCPKFHGKHKETCIQWPFGSTKRFMFNFEGLVKETAGKMLLPHTARILHGLTWISKCFGTRDLTLK